MKKLNKYDLSNSELKRAYDFINAVYSIRYYNSQTKFSNDSSTKKGVIIKDKTSTKTNIKENVEEIPKKKITTEIVEQSQNV